MTKPRIAALVAVLLLPVPPALRAQNADSTLWRGFDEQSLRGVTSAYVMVEGLPQPLLNAGFTREGIDLLATTALRVGVGLNVLAKPDATQPVVVVHFAAIPSTDRSSIAFVLRLRVLQAGRVDRLALPTLVDTWSHETIGISPRNALVGQIKTAIMNALQAFADAHRRANASALSGRDPSSRRAFGSSKSRAAGSSDTRR